MIDVLQVSKTFDGEHFVLKDISFCVEEGETLVLLGSSGSGKSSLLKMINRLIPMTSGDIKINGQSIQHLSPLLLKRSIGYVFQAIGLFPHLTVEDNVAIVLRLLGQDKKQRNRIAHEFLERVGLPAQNYAKRLPAELSGGQQQRVGVARALAANQNILLMDEPFGALDAITRYELQQELLQIKKQFNKTIIFVTHDIFEAFSLGDRIAIFHEGCLLKIGSKEQIFQTPCEPFIQSLYENFCGQIASVSHVTGNCQ